MPEREGHRSHRFLGGDELISSAIELDAHAVRRGAVVGVDVELRAVEVGHSVPTGDPFRRLELSVSSGRETERFVLERTFRRVATRGDDGTLVALRVPHEDSRLGPPGTSSDRRVFSASFQPGAGAVHVELRYVRARSPNEPTGPANSRVVIRRVIPIEERRGE